MTRIIEINIDEIVLHGFESVDAERIKTEVQTELARLISEKGAPALFSSPNKLKLIDAGKISLSKGTKGSSMGSEIAGSLFNGLNSQKNISKK